MNAYKTLRNLALIGTLVGGFGFYKSYTDYNAQIHKYYQFEKLTPATEVMTQISSLENKINLLKRSSLEINSAEVEISNSDGRLVKIARKDHEEFVSEFNQFRSNYLNKIYVNIAEVKRQRDQLITSSEYLQAKPQFDLESKKVSKPFSNTLKFEFLTILSLFGLGFNYLANRKGEK